MKNKRKIKILYVIDVFNGPGAGTERHLYHLASHLDRDRFMTMVCYFDGNNVLAELLQKDGIPVVKIPLNKIYGPEAFLKAFKLAKLIKKNKIDIVQTYHFKSDTYGVLISRISGVSKVISSRRDTGELKKPRQIALNKIMNHFIDHYIVVCDSVGKALKETEGVPEDRMTTIYNGVDLRRFRLNGDEGIGILREQLGIERGEFVIGTAGIFRPEKAFDVLLEGIKKANHYVKNWKAVLIGDGETYSDCRNYCEQHGLNNIVKFVGYTKEVEKYLPIMDVFCLVPNRNEGFSNAILEAMAMGKPVIATDVGGNAEAVIHNETGFIIPPNDSQSLSEAILELYRDPVKRIDMGKKARKKTEETFPIEKMIKEHEKLYEEIFNSRN